MHLIRYSLFPKIFYLTFFLYGFYSTLFAQSWECQDCPKRDLAFFDLDIWQREPPTPGSDLSEKDWLEMFMVAGGILDALFNEDPSKECINFYDGQMVTINEWGQNDYTYGSTSLSLPPASGMSDNIEYFISGLIAKQKSDNTYVIKAYIQTGGTGETVVASTSTYDFSISGAQNGKKVAQDLMPLMQHIRDFEKRKRDEDKEVVIAPDGKGAVKEIKPEKEIIMVGEPTKVEIKLIDCDGVPIKDMDVTLTSEAGSFAPEKVKTDRDGKAKSEFTAECNPGKSTLTMEFKARFPYSNTKDEFGETKGINITCWDATLELKKQVTKEIVKNKSEDSFEGNCKQHSEEHYKLNETIDASVFVDLELEYSVDMPVFNQTYEYYKPKSVNLSSFNYTSRDSKIMTGDNSGMGCASGGYETKVEKVRTLDKREIQGKEAINQARWILAIDNKTKKAVKIIPAGYGIDYEITENESINSSVWSDKGTKNDSKTNTKTSDKSFKLGPVKDPIPDPTVKSNSQWVKDYLERQGVNLPPGVNIPTQDNKDAQGEINPDLLVKSGDGETNFGGEGSKPIYEPNEYGYEKEDLHYSWHMTRKKKNK
jgi:hypothetical protein